MNNDYENNYVDMRVNEWVWRFYPMVRVSDKLERFSFKDSKNVVLEMNNFVEIIFKCKMNQWERPICKVYVGNQGQRLMRETGEMSKGQHVSLNNIKKVVTEQLLTFELNSGIMDEHRNYQKSKETTTREIDVRITIAPCNTKAFYNYQRSHNFSKDEE